MAVKDTTIIPGQGWVFYSEVDTAPFDLKGFDSADPTKILPGGLGLVLRLKRI
ncbi:hypothetical protein HHJ81_06565 [Mobiluncus mulieris]|uniref:hypothetical protein n=1 Tax=Mobiluncus mulieris TaxID=2052 RepID=UPI00146FEB15|nr:hypothetical protein [Mobiluncus mulieris]NMW60751.1 hypothetical protein [Mobiluncus mulieris]